MTNIERSDSGVTSQMSRESLELYQRAALQTGFSVEIIAGEGETFKGRVGGRIIREIPIGRHTRFETRIEPDRVVDILVQQGNIAIRVTRLDGGIDHSVFGQALKALEAEQANS